MVFWYVVTETKVIFDFIYDKVFEVSDVWRVKWIFLSQNKEKKYDYFDVYFGRAEKSESLR